MDSGAKLHTYYYLNAMSAKHDVHMVAFVRYDEEWLHVGEVENICKKLVCVPLKRGKLSHAATALSCFASKTNSFIINRDFRQDMQDAVNKEIAEFAPDVVYIDHLQMAQYADLDGPYKTVLDHHNVESMIIKRMSQTTANPAVRIYTRAEWPKLLNYELDVCRRASMVFTVTELDKAIIQDMAPEVTNIHCLPVGLDLDYFGSVERDPNSRNILSIATMYWPPNVDSMLYFYNDIYPLVRKMAPDCRLTIAGQRPVKSIRALAKDPTVTVTGYVDDIRKTATDCGVFIVPLRAGSGLRQKILNALGMGLPIVSTSVGAEGIDVTDGENVILADTPSDFANAVIKVLQDRELADKLSKNGRALAAEKYSQASVTQKMLSLLDEHTANCPNSLI